jgi:hypothetical protein
MANSPDSPLEIRLQAVTDNDGQTVWMVTADNDGSPDFDATGRTPDLALYALCEVLYEEYYKQEARITARDKEYRGE